MADTKTGTLSSGGDEELIEVIPAATSIAGGADESMAESRNAPLSVCMLHTPLPMVLQMEEEEPPAKQRSRIRLFAVLTALFLSLFVAALDQTIIATAVPTISSELQSSSGYVWIMSAYLLANAAGGPIWAKLSDIWGRKPILLTAVAMFFASSIVCAMSSSMKMLIVGRALQGTAGGGLMQLVNITISDLFSVRERSLYLGLLEFMWAVAGGVGPVLGGAFTQLVSWRWCFWINLPISGSTFIMLLIFLDVHNPKTKLIDGMKAIDWFGSLSIIGLVLMLLLGLEFGGATFPWNSPQVICLIVFGSLMSLLFIYSEKRLAQYPLMPLELLRSRSNVAALTLNFFQGMVFIAMEYYMPLFLQAVFGASPLQSGVLIVPITVSEATMGILTGVLIHRTGRYLEIIYCGTILMTVGVGLYISLTPTSSIVKVVCFQIIAGLGAGSLFEPPLIALQAGVHQDDIATVTSMIGFTRNLATSLSIVVGGVVFQNSMDGKMESLLAIGVPESIINLLSDGRAAANVMMIAGITDETYRTAVKEAFAMSIRNMWIMYTCIAACTFLSGMFISKRILSKVHTETKTGLKKKRGVVAVA